MGVIGQTIVVRGNHAAFQVKCHQKGDILKRMLKMLLLCIYTNIVSTHYKMASRPKYITKNIQLVRNSSHKT